MEEEGEYCAICLCEIRENTHCELSPCSHKFHSSCIQEWLTNKQTCPICRSPGIACQHDSIGDHSKNVLVRIIESQSQYIRSLSRDTHIMATTIASLGIRLRLLLLDLEHEHQQQAILRLMVESLTSE